jgi:hypothetical protein
MAKSNSNPNDSIRDAILRYLYKIHNEARSPKSAAIGIRDLASALKPHGFKLQEVASNLDYLLQKDWVKEVREDRTFTTPRGTTQTSAKITYKISAEGIDKLEAASIYKRPSLGGQVNITTINGVTVVGDGNVVNTHFTDLSRILTELRQAVVAGRDLNDEKKLEVASDIDTLQSQLQKPTPDKTISALAWSAIEKAASVGGLVDLVQKAGQLLQPLIG